MLDLMLNGSDLSAFPCSLALVLLKSASDQMNRSLDFFFLSLSLSFHIRPSGWTLPVVIFFVEWYIWRILESSLFLPPTQTDWRRSTSRWKHTLHFTSPNLSRIMSVQAALSTYKFPWTKSKYSFGIFFGCNRINFSFLILSLFYFCLALNP